MGEVATKFREMVGFYLFISLLYQLGYKTYNISAEFRSFRNGSPQPMTVYVPD